ncbi:MAG TPA: hypothetical protein VII52_04885 [Gemmatimonadaceae bacterium]
MDQLDFRLTAVIADDPALCPDHATDHPTAIVSFFWSTRVQQITDYHGCFLRSDHSTAAPLAALRQLEKAIDSVSGSARWTRPNRFRGAPPISRRAVFRIAPVRQSSDTGSFPIVTNQYAPLASANVSHRKEHGS